MPQTANRVSIDKLKHGDMFFDVVARDIMILVSGNDNWQQADRIAYSLRTSTFVRYIYPFTNRCFVPKYSEDIPQTLISPVTRS